MPVVSGDAVVRITGIAAVEDAEPLVAALDATPGASLDLSAATALHAAVLQVILAFRPPLVATPLAAEVGATLSSAGLLSAGARAAA